MEVMVFRLKLGVAHVPVFGFDWLGPVIPSLVCVVMSEVVIFVECRVVIPADPGKEGEYEGGGGGGLNV